MFSRLFEFLNKDLTGRTWYTLAHHPYFGEMTYYGFKKDDGYWECEIEFENESISITINSPEEVLPAIEHEEFAKSILANLDAVFIKIKDLMYSTFEDWKEIKLAEDWRQAFKLSGFVVPLYADINNNWEISFECLLDKDGHYFICEFESGIPAFVSVEG